MKNPPITEIHAVLGINPATGNEEILADAEDYLSNGKSGWLIAFGGDRLKHLRQRVRELREQGVPCALVRFTRETTPEGRS